ncbi:MAG: ribonucleotide-diphosphate reductase subunit beta, partial [Fusobacteriaceae bacterium]
NMARAFSYQETVHAKAYDFLEATLGINSCEGFINDPISTKKIEDIFKYLNEDFCTQLAIFSGGVEGVSLFSSFAILLSFLKDNRFKGIGQILSWSTLDENLHSKFGIDLFKTYCREESVIPNTEAIYEAFRLIVENEVFVLNQIFIKGDLPSVRYEEALAFLYYRANMKLIELELEPLFPSWKEYRNLKSIFDLQVFGKTQNDFFALSRNGGAYSAMSSRDYSNISF